MPPTISYTTATLRKQWVNPVQATVVTRAQATLTSTNMTGGSAPSSSITPPGWGTGACPTHHDRGHLIGNHLGGPGDVADNLVTLTAGTNHPFMYEFEDAVRRYVLANTGVQHVYTVECDYDAYTATQGFQIPGAGGNPFCLFPAPAGLYLSLVSGGTAVTLGTLASYFPNPPTDLGAAAAYTRLWIPNGGYKLYSGATHTASTCWSVTQDASSPVVQTNATAYARGLGHIP